MLKHCLIILFSSLAFFVSPSFLSAQLEQVEVQIPSETIRANQRFTLTLKIPDYGISSPQAVLPSFNGVFTLISGPEITAGEGIDRQGRRNNYRFMRYVLRANIAGHFVIPSFVLNFGTQVISVPETLIKVASEDDISWIPPRLEWHINENTLYQGQSFLVSLRLRFVSKIEFPQGLEFVKPQNYVMEEISGLDTIGSEIIASQSFNLVPVASWLISTTQPGTFSLPEAKIRLGKKIVSVRSSSFIVQPIPPDLGSSGAIGELDFKVLIDQKKVLLNQAFVFTIRVEGDGNLAVLKLPEPDFGSLEIVGSGENRRYVPSPKGYRGFTERSWSLKTSVAGYASIQVPAFPVLISNGNLRINPAQNLSIEVLSSQDHNQVTGKNSVPSIDSTTIVEPYFRLDRFPANIVIQLPLGLLLASILIFKLVRPKRRRLIVLPSVIIIVLATIAAILMIVFSTVDSMAAEDHELLNQVQQNASNGNYQRAQELLHKLTVKYPRNADLHFQTGIAAARNYSPALALFYLDKALRLESEKHEFDDFKQFIEAGLSLERQIPLSISIPAPVLTISSMLLMLVMILAFLLKRRGKKAGFWVFIMLCTLLWFINAGLLFLQLQQKNSQVAVLCEPGGFLRKIPEAKSMVWLELAGGTSVSVLARSNDYLLIETSYGIKGWIDRTALYTWDRLVLETRQP